MSVSQATAFASLRSFGVAVWRSQARTQTPPPQVDHSNEKLIKQPFALQPVLI